MEAIREKTYERINWEDEPSVVSPINATNLNRMDYAIDAIDDRVIELDTVKSEESEALVMIADVAYNETTGLFTFTRKNGETIEADINIEKIPVSFSMSEAGIITMRTADGEYYTADVAALIKKYNFVDSDQVNFTTTVDEKGDYKITAEILSGSITESMLETHYLAEIKIQAAAAKGSMDRAIEAETTSKNKATEAANSAATAEGKATDAGNSAASALSSATVADQRATDAEESAATATEKATNAATSERNAEEAANAAALSKTLAEEAAATATKDAGDAKISADNAEVSEILAEQYKGDAANSASEASATLEQIRKENAKAYFEINFETGELIYTNSSTYTFIINQETGNLEWRVN